MKSEIVYDALTDIAPELIKEADSAPKRKKRYLPWISAIAAVLAVAVLCGVLLRPGGVVIEAHAVAQPQYPEMAKYPDIRDYGLSEESMDWDSYAEAYNKWYDSKGNRAPYRIEYSVQDLSGFVRATLPQFLSGAAGENRVYSPLNIYMALALLAETADGEGREQILGLMGIDSMDQLRTRVKAIWNVNYNDDGLTESILANSLWLDDEVKFRQETLDLLAENYYASSYYGTMGTEEMNDLLRDWMNEQTGGLLQDQIDGLELDDDTVAALVSTVYYCGRWENEFGESATEESIFHAQSGDEPCYMMHQNDEDVYYWADQFSAVGKSFDTGGNMWFILPDEGITPENLLTDPQVASFLLSKGDWDNQKYLTVKKQIVKFDIDAQIDAKQSLQALGVTDVFDPEKADFSPLAGQPQEIFVSRILHGTRVMIDEEGCKAAAYSLSLLEAAAAEPPEEEVDFILDRPFIFAITGTDGLPLFIGIVNHPNV